MKMELIKTISELSSLPAPSGFEDLAADRIHEMMASCMNEVWRDTMGNVIGVKRSRKAGAKKLLLDAHMDEVGIIITGNEEGFLKFQPLGSLDPRNLPGSEVVLMTDPPMSGVIACLPPHVLSAEEKEKVIQVKDLCIDAGLSDREASEQIPPGTPGVFKSGFFRLGENQFSGKAFDNRVCVAVMLDALSKLKDRELDVELYAMASSQEELGTRGATTGAFSIEPDYCVAIDVTFGKTPGSPKTGTYKLGGGPTIGIGPNINMKLYNRLVELCENNSIPYQIEVMAGQSGTNAWPIQISRGGVATAILSVPLKYMHSPIETFAVSDAQAASDILVKLLENWEYPAEQI
jgi:endoglucanase